METKIRVLIADPGEDFRRMLADIIDEEGDMEVVGSTGDGAEALALAMSLRPELLLTELLLPNLDGLALLEKLQQADAMPAVLVASAFSMTGWCRTAPGWASAIFCPSPAMCRPC